MTGLFGFLSVLLMIGCASSPPAAPSVPALEPLVITYAINVPSAVIANELRGFYPDGVMLSPIEAQERFDFRSIYRVPNVYYGVQAPPDGVYTTGIVVAPLSAASKRVFTHADWALCPAVCAWLGRFEYAQPAQS